MDPFENPLMKLKDQVQPFCPQGAVIVDIKQHPWDEEKLNVKFKINQQYMIIGVKAKKNKPEEKKPEIKKDEPDK